MTFRPVPLSLVCLFVLIGVRSASAQFEKAERIHRLPPIRQFDSWESQWFRTVNHEEAAVGADFSFASDDDSGTNGNTALGDNGSANGDSHTAPEVVSPLTGESPFSTSNQYYVDPLPGYAPYGSGGLGYHTGAFFQYEHLFWVITPPDTTVIGDLPSEGFVTVDGVTYFEANSLDTSFLDYRLDGAERFEFGHTDGMSGWMTSIVFGRSSQTARAQGVTFVPDDPDNLLNGYWDGNNDGFDDDLDGDGIFGRSGFDSDGDGEPDTGSAVDTDDLVRLLVTFGEMRVNNHIDMAGAEIMKTVRKTPNFQWLYGLRYFSLKDVFTISGSSASLGNANLAVIADNRMFGPQIGARWNGAWDRIVVNAEARFMAAVNFQRTSQGGSVGDGLTFAAGEPAALGPTAFKSSFDEEEFSPLGEFRLDAILPINRYMAFRFGYTAVVVGGVSYASPKITYQLPGFGLTDAASDEGVFSGAFTLGLEINR